MQLSQTELSDLIPDRIWREIDWMSYAHYVDFNFPPPRQDYYLSLDTKTGRKFVCFVYFSCFFSLFFYFLIFFIHSFVFIYLLGCLYMFKATVYNLELIFFFYLSRKYRDFMNVLAYSVGMSEIIFRSKAEEVIRGIWITWFLSMVSFVKIFFLHFYILII
jgi:hypothetical protein